MEIKSINVDLTVDEPTALQMKPVAASYVDSLFFYKGNDACEEGVPQTNRRNSPSNIFYWDLDMSSTCINDGLTKFVLKRSTSMDGVLKDKATLVSYTGTLKIPIQNKDDIDLDKATIIRDIDIVWP